VGEWMRRRGGKKKREDKMEKKEKTREIGLFTISIQLLDPFCQTFFKTASTPSKEPLH
jgi:hypothetical protein